MGQPKNATRTAPRSRYHRKPGPSLDPAQRRFPLLLTREERSLIEAAAQAEDIPMSAIVRIGAMAEVRRRLRKHGLLSLELRKTRGRVMRARARKRTSGRERSEQDLSTTRNSAAPSEWPGMGTPLPYGLAKDWRVVKDKATRPRTKRSGVPETVRTTPSRVRKAVPAIMHIKTTWC